MHNPEFKLSQVRTIMLGVRDCALSLAFYRDKLGLSVKIQVPGFAFLDAGGVTLGLSEPLARALGRPDSPLAGAAEVVFSVDDVKGAYQALRRQGVEFTREPRNVAGDSWAANFNDPDGHTLSIFGPEHQKV